MRLDRIVLVGVLLTLTGCMTTTTQSGSSLGGRLAASSKSDDALDAARVHTELGQRYLAQGDLETAMQKLTKALQFDPNYAPAHTVMAVLDERIHRMADAEMHYRRAVALEPAKGDPNNNLGQFLCSVGKTSEALGYFRKAVADPFYKTPSLALTNQGVCQLRAGDKAGAEASFRSAIERNPQNGEALLELAGLLFHNGDTFHARAFIQRYDALGAPTAGSLRLGYDIETRLGNRDAAQTYRRRLQGQFPDSEQARTLDTIVRQ